MKILNCTTLIIGNRNYSGWSMRAWLALRKSGVPFKTIRLPLNSCKYKNKIIELSPTQRVPAFHHEGHVIWDSLSICEYVNEISRDYNLWPYTPHDRSKARSIAAEIHSSYIPLRKNLPFNCRAKNRSIHIDNDSKINLARIENIIDNSDTTTQGPWLFGKFCIADAMLIPIALRLYTYNVIVGVNLQKYILNVLSDPDVQEWISLASEEKEFIDSEEIGLNI